jgi:hypothetical protein
LLAAAHPPWRLAAKRLAVAMASSVPGVLLFQIIAAPFVALAAATAVGVHSVVGELHGASQALFASVFLLSTLGVFAAASLLGFLVVSWLAIEVKVRPNPSLQPTCYGWLRQPAQAAELKR